MFVTITDESGGQLSAYGRTIVARLRAALEKAVAPASVRETGRFSELQALLGDDIYSRCQ